LAPRPKHSKHFIRLSGQQRQTVPIRAQNRHHLPHLSVSRTSKTVLPSVHDRCCNSHFGCQMIRSYSMLPELHGNPIRHRFHACGQGGRLRWFPRLLLEFDRNMAVCNTQQGYSPPGRGEIVSPCLIFAIKHSIQQLARVTLFQKDYFTGGKLGVNLRQRE